MGTLETLCSQFAHVLVQVVGHLLPSALAVRVLRLTGLPGTWPEERIHHLTHTLRAWSDAGKPSRPDPDGIWHIPALRPQDELALQQGILSIVTPAGRALGRIARDLARLKVGLALGAGGTKGYAHIGVLRVLERIGLPIDYLAGTSIGAVVAGLYAANYSLEEIAELLDKTGATAFRLTLPLRSLLSNRGVRADIQQVGGQKRFEELDIPLALVAADLITQQEVVFKSGLVWPAVLASISIPGIYPPQRIGPYTLVDGGILNPLPADVVTEMGADRVIGVRLSSRPGSSRQWAETEHTISEGPSVIQTLIRSLDLMQSKISASTTAATTILIEAVLRESGGASLRHFSQGRRFIDQGEATAEAALPRLAAAFPWLSS
jgi:NTE family protein